MSTEQACRLQRKKLFFEEMEFLDSDEPRDEWDDRCSIVGPHLYNRPHLSGIPSVPTIHRASKQPSSSPGLLISRSYFEKTGVQVEKPGPTKPLASPQLSNIPVSRSLFDLGDAPATPPNKILEDAIKMKSLNPGNLSQPDKHEINTVEETPLESIQHAIYDTPRSGPVLPLPPTNLPHPKIKDMKRKRTVEIKMVPEHLRIFRGLVFYFIPNNEINDARRTRITRSIEYGANWQREWHPAVTHIIADKDLTIDDVLKHTPVKLSDSVFIVSDRYPGDCIEHRLLLNPQHVVYRLNGHPLDQHDPSRSTPANDSQSSAQSLKIRAKRKHSSIVEIETPPRTEESTPRDGTGGRYGVLAKLSPTKYRQSMQLDQVPTSSPIKEPSAVDQTFEDIMNEVKGLEHLPLDSDDECTTGIFSLKAPETTNDKVEKVPYFQTLFTCMQDPNNDSKVTNPNIKTIELLEQMMKYYDSVQDHWRTIAYRKAIGVLKKQKDFITTREQAEKLPGVGTRLAAKIEEIVWTSRLRRLESAQLEPREQILQLFLRIYGVGFSTASKWIQKGFENFDDLRQHADLTENQIIGIEHYDDFATRIPREEVARHGEIVQRAISELDRDAHIPSKPRYLMEIGGSYRRGAESSGDIDIVITKPGSTIGELRTFVLTHLIPHLEKTQYLTATLAATSRDEGSKWHGACQLPAREALTLESARQLPRQPWRRIDFLLVPWAEIGAAMIYFTGDDIFNRSLRLLAKKKGYHLNQKGLYKDVLRDRSRNKITEGVLVEGRDERRIFEILGVPWREPTQRNLS